ncbi:MAG TPA: hypothetical protein VFQ73_15025 [Flavisolibacter sp.]|nr:hypothetical protein [Flavisolibacter sp.]
MQQIFPSTILETNLVSCTRCDWQGKGSEYKTEELILTDAIELYCPACNGYQGFVSVHEGSESDK